MNPTPRVSVIIPSYNCAELVGRAIESVFAQTLAERDLSAGASAKVDIVLVDDGSTDSTCEALSAYMGRPDFHYVYQENRGLPGARNTGIKQARGEFIFLLDADDRIAPNCLERHVEIADREKADWVTCDLLRVEGENERVIETRLPRENALAWAIEHEFKLNAFFFRRAAIERAGLFDEGQRVYEDIDLYARLLREGAPVSCLAEPLYIYMIRGGSLTKEGKRLRNLGFMERFYRRHYREMARAGNRDAARMYGALMWRQAGNYREAGGGTGHWLSCLFESLRFAPGETFRSIWRKIFK